MLLTVFLLFVLIALPALCIIALCKASARADYREAAINAHLDQGHPAWRGKKGRQPNPDAERLIRQPRSGD